MIDVFYIILMVANAVLIVSGTYEGLINHEYAKASFYLMLALTSYVTNHVH